LYSTVDRKRTARRRVGRRRRRREGGEEEKEKEAFKIIYVSLSNINHHTHTPTNHYN